MLRGFKIPKDSERYSWTQHAIGKMHHYGISENLVKRIVRHPARTEDGIAPRTVAVMQPTRTKRPQEYWVMWTQAGRKKRIISAWRYPGVSPAGKEIPIPDDIREELEAEDFTQ